MIRLKKSISIIFLSSLLFSTFANDLPNGYKNISLGMSLEETKTELMKDSDFGYHGDRDISLLPRSNKTLIETDSEYGLGSSFLRHCYFQFNENKLYIITININPDKMDYYTVFTKLCQKYGEPDSLNPQCAIWKNNEISMSLEKPLTLKYVDIQTFESVQQYVDVPKATSERQQEEFLEEL